MRILKMHGLGNDFIIAAEIPADPSRAAAAVCDRKFGVGADGLIFAQPSEIADVKMRIINSDGGEAEMCGNGIRCFARYLFDRGFVGKKMTIETLAGIMRPEIIEEGENVRVRVNMGKPDFSPSAVPVNAQSASGIVFETETGTIEAQSLLMGVPHTVVFTDDVKNVPLEEYGAMIEKNPIFPQGTNVNFAQIINPAEIKIRTWERGCGHTLACGTGSCATAAAAHRAGLAESEVDLLTEAGVLKIELMPDGDVFMTGAAEYILDGVTL